MKTIHITRFEGDFVRAYLDGGQGAFDTIQLEIDTEGDHSLEDLIALSGGLQEVIKDLIEEWEVRQGVTYSHSAAYAHSGDK
jgi:hypothetical protein